MTQQTIIDFVSFSGTPEILDRCKAIAKDRLVYQQNSYKGHAPSFFENVQSSADEVELLNFTELLAGEIGDTVFGLMNEAIEKASFKQDATLSFNECYEELLNTLGLSVLDNICYGEIEKFLFTLNNEISKSGNEWTLEKRGGYSGYQYSAVLLCNGVQSGLVAWGAKNFGFYVSFSGTGCSAIKMPVLKNALSQIPRVKLTRVDIALDDLHGTNNINTVRKAYDKGMFITQGKPPSYSYIESGSLIFDKNTLKRKAINGKTFYVGSRDNGKLFRAYEKGKQLQSKEFENWVRFEVEIRANKRVLPLDMLINSDSYFTGAYPRILTKFLSVPPVKIKINKLIVQATFDKYLNTAKTQYGKFINFLNLVYQDEKTVINLMTNKLTVFDIPERLKFPNSEETEKIENLNYSKIHYST